MLHARASITPVVLSSDTPKEKSLVRVSSSSILPWRLSWPLAMSYFAVPLPRLPWATEVVLSGVLRRKFQKSRKAMVNEVSPVICGDVYTQTPIALKHRLTVLRYSAL